VKWSAVPLVTPTSGDKATPRDVAGGDQFSGAQRGERGHRLVIDSMVGGAGLVTLPGW
jgi:hypothetical protein